MSAAPACDGAASMGPRPPAADRAQASRATARATRMGALQVSSSLMVSMPRTTMHTWRGRQGGGSRTHSRGAGREQGGVLDETAEEEQYWWRPTLALGTFGGQDRGRLK